MNFLTTVRYELLDSWTTVLFGVGFVFVLLTLVITAGVPSVGFSQLSKKQKRVLVFGWLASFGLIVGLPVIYHTETSQQNANLVANLKEKYDIKTVDFDRNDYVSASYREPLVSMSRAQNIIIITNDDNKAVFILRQDVHTSEPTLSELPFATTPLSSIIKH
jgi:hypothetical protein